MTKDETLKLALEKVANALPAYIEGTPAREYLAVIHSALAAPVQEPVAWICNHYEEGVKNDVDYWQDDIDALPVGTPLYTTPPAAPDLQAELEATNRQVEILSDALAESRREIDAVIALARADERESCAKVCDRMAARCNDIRAAALESAAENIRARGNI
jgi:hypothetical protein